MCAAPSSCVAKASIFKRDAQPNPNDHIHLHQFSASSPSPEQYKMPPTEDKRKAARETIDVLYEISSLLVRLRLSTTSCRCVESIVANFNPYAGCLL